MNKIEAAYQIGKNANSPVPAMSSECMGLIAGNSVGGDSVKIMKAFQDGYFAGLLERTRAEFA